jgi:hypothetical protein
MTYESAIPELFTRFPYLQGLYKSKLAYLADEEPLPYVIFGDILVPSIEAAMDSGDTSVLSAICEYLEDMAVSEDPALENLLGVEIGEWLGFTAIADRISPFLGEKTKQICGYVPGLAAQRRLRNGQV